MVRGSLVQCLIIIYLGVFSEKSEMNSLVLRSGAKMPSIGFGTFVGGKNSADAYKGIWI